MLNDRQDDRGPMKSHDSEASTRKGGIQSVERAFQILQVISEAGAALRLSEIVRLTGFASNLIHAYLISLRNVGMVSQEPESGRYGLGERAIHLGLAALSRMDYFSLAEDAMHALRDTLGESVWLTVWNETGPIIVAKVEGRHKYPFEVKIGTKLHATITATGRTLLAHIPKSVWQSVVDEERKSLGRLAPSLRALDKILKQIRQDGIATYSNIAVPLHSLAMPGFSALAAPVFDHKRDVKAALTVLGKTDNFDVALDGINAKILKDAADRLSNRLGYKGSPQ